MEKIRIATLNLNGQMWHLVDRTLRLPKSLYDSEKIKTELTNKTVVGLLSILKSKEYDIIAIQELVRLSGNFQKIKEIVEFCDYIYIEPKSVTKPGKGNSTPNFTVAYIIKKDVFESYEIINDCDNNNNNDYNNRVFCMEIALSNNKGSFKFINVHVNVKDKDTFKSKIVSIAKNFKDENCIVLGDFNASTKKQTENVKDDELGDSTILSDISELEYIYCGKNENYTFLSKSNKRKLDHMFISKSLNETFNVSDEHINHSVNFCPEDDGNGFTDHSMLYWDISIKSKNKIIK